MKKVTELQYSMLVKIIEDDFTWNNGDAIANLEEGEDACMTYVEMIIESAQDRGTFTSLQNAGLVARHNAGTRDDLCWLTEEAVDLMRELYAVA